MMSKEISIHVSYESHTFLVKCLPQKFINYVSKKIEVEPKEIEIYLKSNLNQKIGLGDLTNGTKVCIRKKVLEEYNCTSSTSMDTVLTKKIEENTPLSRKEFEYFCRNVKRRADLKTKNPKKIMKNRKLQVDPSSLGIIASSSTQTDGLMNVDLNSTATNNTYLRHIRKLAAEGKGESSEASDLMSKSYEKRRNFIFIDTPMIDEVKSKYPLLFNRAEIKKELDRIFYQGKSKEFIKNIEKYAPHILNAARDDDNLLLSTNRKMKTFLTPEKKSYAQEVGSILMAVSIMHEDRDFLCVQDKPFESTSLPHITCNVGLNELYYLDRCTYSIYAEHQLICEAGDLKEAILCLLATYFIFHISYQESNFNTLVFFEKLYLEAPDTDEMEIDDYVKQTIETVRLKCQAQQR